MSTATIATTRRSSSARHRARDVAPLSLPHRSSGRTHRHAGRQTGGSRGFTAIALIPALIFAVFAASGCKAQPRNAPLFMENLTFSGFSVSGTAPDFVTTVATGEVIAGTVSIFDYDGDTVTMTAAITGGSLTATQAGLTTTFPLTVTAGMIVEFEIEGTTKTTGTVEITVTADDGVHDAITFRLTLNIVQEAAVVAFVTQPTTVAAGETFASPGVQVSIRDSQGNPIVGRSMAIKLTPGADTPALVGTTTAITDPLTGIATFDAVYLTKAGTNYMLVTAVAANGPNFTATSTPFAAMPLVPTQIVFATQPTGTTLGVPLGPILVQLFDSFGNLATNADTDITLEFGANPSNATLLGTTTRSAVDGVATFDDVRPDLRGVGYTLIARMSAGAATATSAAFNVFGLAAQLISDSTKHHDGRKNDQIGIQLASVVSNRETIINGSCCRSVVVYDIDPVYPLL